MSFEEIYLLLAGYDGSRKSEAIATYNDVRELATANALSLLGAAESKARDQQLEDACELLRATEALGYVFLHFHGHAIDAGGSQAQSLENQYEPSWSRSSAMSFGIPAQESGPRTPIILEEPDWVSIMHDLKIRFPDLEQWMRPM
ncbi:hypothetical protein [Rhizobium sp. Rhizsp82]|uniref:hypothetical protein n=1 Tax=Rhizobium sp. Rhizsp82 TaxID=3243057 RepID=UPI0039B4D142